MEKRQFAMSYAQNQDSSSSSDEEKPIKKGNVAKALSIMHVDSDRFSKLKNQADSALRNGSVPEALQKYSTSIS